MQLQGGWEGQEGKGSGGGGSWGVQGGSAPFLLDQFMRRDSRAQAWCYLVQVKREGPQNNNSEATPPSPGEDSQKP